MADFVIGTAQFGLDYGVSNQGGQVSAAEASQILEKAWARGCRWLDTAAAYGNAEQTLGQLAASKPFHLCSKVGAKVDGDPTGLADELTTSLEHLGRASVDILLLHRSEWLRDSRAATVRGWAERERAMGRIGAFGVSIYTPDELDAVLGGGVDWVQLPLSVLAQDWLRPAHIERLKEAGVQIQARSVLAQGLVTVDPEYLPEALEALHNPLTKLREAAHAHNASPLRLALAFAAQAPIDMIVIGVDSAPQLNECIDALNDRFDLPWADFACPDARAVDPRFWPAGLRIAA